VIAAKVDLEFFWDPICPFAWQTSNWVRRVATLRNLNVEWRLMSLAILNRDQVSGTDKIEEHRKGQRMLRVAASVRAAEGQLSLAIFYEVLGHSIWDITNKESVDYQLYLGTEKHLIFVLEHAGFDLKHAAAADQEFWDAELQVETEEAISRSGPGVGTPILTFFPPNGPSIFGPVISEVPESDEDCLVLYDSVLSLASNSSFFELKRTNRLRPDLPALKRSLT